MDQETISPETTRRLGQIWEDIRSGRAHFNRQEWENSRADRINQNHGRLTGYDCPECKNRGYIAYMDGDDVRIRQCSCVFRRRNKERIEKSGLQDVVDRYTFESWQCQEPWQVEAKAKAEQYAQERSGWFLAFGSVGTGKSHLCTAICVKLMEAGYDTLYSVWRDTATRAKAVVNDPYAYESIVNPLKTVPVLYIDDFYKTGKGQEPTTADVNLAFEILNARYIDSKLLTIISTERTMPELMDIDEAVGSRIYERCKGYGVSFVGRKNWRLMT